MRVIGLTGGIGTGKSEVSKALANLGAQVIDADSEGHRAYRKGTIGWRRIVEIFSSELLDEQDEVDRARLGALVFNNPQALAWLNAAIHPLIRRSVTDAVRLASESSYQAAIIDAALLYQAGWDNLTDEVWAVTAPPEMVENRLQTRGMEQAEIQRRLDAQGEQATWLTKATIVINNAGSLEDLENRVQQLWNERILKKGSAIHGRAD